MIHQGSEGSILCFVDNKIIASYPLTKKKPFNYYKQFAEDILLKALREGKWTCKTAGIKTLKLLMSRRFYNRKYLQKDDEESIIIMGLILHKLKIWDYDDPYNGLFVATARKKPRIQRPKLNH